MPRRRNPENAKLPARWEYYHKAFYYRVPPGLEPYWDHRQRFRLGSTYEEAVHTFVQRATSPKLAADVPPEKLLPLTQLHARRTPRVDAGVYFLFLGDEVVYVGRSNNILARISDHAMREAMRFDAYCWIPATGLEQIRLEQLYIGRLRPRYNVQHAC